MKFLGSKAKENQVNSLYIHIPFCHSKCPYCDFYSKSNDDPHVHRKYLNALIRELDTWREFADFSAVETLYVGGGTPTLLTAPLFEEFLNKIVDIPKSKPVEFTIEANPESVTEEKLIMMKESGVTRVSLGIQSLNDEVLRFLGRIHSSKEALRAAELVKNAFIKLNVDIIFGIPGEPIESLKKTIKGVLKIYPESASFYALTVKGSGFKGRNLKNDDEVYKEYEMVCRELLASGYEHYEVSNWARKGFYCIHNMNYWERKPYLGIGPSAASLMDQFRFSYVPHLEDFLSPNPSLYFEELSKEQILLEKLYLTLRTNKGLSYKYFLEEGLIAEEEKLNELVASSYAFISGDKFFLTEKGLFLADAIVRFLIQ